MKNLQFLSKNGFLFDNWCQYLSVFQITWTPYINYTSDGFSTFNYDLIVHQQQFHKDTVSHFTKIYPFLGFVLLSGNKISFSTVLLHGWYDTLNRTKFETIQ